MVQDSTDKKLMQDFRFLYNDLDYINNIKE